VNIASAMLYHFIHVTNSCYWHSLYNGAAVLILLQLIKWERLQLIKCLCIAERLCIGTTSKWPYWISQYLHVLYFIFIDLQLNFSWFFRKSWNYSSASLVNQLHSSFSEALGVWG